MEYSMDSIRMLEKQYGMPLYCFLAEEFEDNLREFVDTFTGVYEHYRLAYSYKTNYTPAICRLVKKHGGFAEVVSDMEYRLAKQLGYENAHIIYNGPCKGPLAWEHLDHGGLLNVDSLQELRDICRYAREHGEKAFTIGLRINLEVGQPFVSRFGIDADSENLPRAVEMVKQTENLTVVGLHCHISQARAKESWQRRTEYMLEIADRFFPEGLQYLDLGSGMYGKMAPSFAAQFSNVSTYAEYAQVTARLVADHYSNSPTKPLLFTEPGTTVVNMYMDFIVQVTGIKTIRGKTFVVTNGSSHNIGEVCKLKRLPIRVIPGGAVQEAYEDADIVGFTCLEHDVMYSGFRGALAVGDYIVFGNTGGYSNVSKPPFIQPNCAMIALAGAEAQLIKRAETVEDIFRTYL